MKIKQKSRLTLTGWCILLVIGLISCGNQEQKKISFGKWPIDTTFIPLHSMPPYSTEEAKRDSTIKHFRITSAIPKWDRKEEESFMKDTNAAGIAPLWMIHRYGEYGSLFNGGVHIYDVVNKVKWFLGFKRNEMGTWDSSMRRTVEKFDQTLSPRGKRTVAKTLQFNAELIDSLSLLSDTNLVNLIYLMENIVKNQNENGEWLYGDDAKWIFRAEYKILKKVWRMPPLMRRRFYKDGAEYFFLGKVNGWDNVWNTRYLNMYQYTIGVAHRRIRDTGAQTAEEMRTVIIKTAQVMHDAAELLEQKRTK